MLDVSSATTLEGIAATKGLQRGQARLFGHFFAHGQEAIVVLGRRLLLLWGFVGRSSPVLSFHHAGHARRHGRSSVLHGLVPV